MLYRRYSNHTVKCPQRRLLREAIQTCLANKPPNSNADEDEDIDADVICIKMPPGSRVERVTKYILTKRVYEDIVIQTLDTYRKDDYYPALENKEMLKAKWITVVMNIAVVSALAQHFTGTPIIGLLNKLKFKK